MMFCLYFALFEETYLKAYLERKLICLFFEDVKFDMLSKCIFGGFLFDSEK